jgi:hypothetical protein
MELRRFATIIVGNYGTTGELLAAVKAADIKVDRYAESMFDKFEVEKAEEEVFLAIATPKELGFEEGALIVDIIEKAKEFGLGKCIPEVAAQIMIQGDDIVFEEEIIVAADAIQDADGDFSLFVLNCEDGEIESRYGVDNDDINPDDILVFVQSGLQTVNA